WILSSHLQTDIDGLRCSRCDQCQSLLVDATGFLPAHLDQPAFRKSPNDLWFGNRTEGNIGPSVQRGEQVESGGRQLEDFGLGVTSGHADGQVRNALDRTRYCSVLLEDWSNIIRAAKEHDAGPAANAAWRQAAAPVCNVFPVPRHHASFGQGQFAGGDLVHIGRLHGPALMARAKKAMELARVLDEADMPRRAGIHELAH